MEIQDKIGREDIVNKITALIDNLSTNEHFCLALDGEWGSGKSFVLDMLYEELQDNDTYLVVKYDAWECSFYDEPLVAILSSIVDGAFDKLPTLPGGKQAFKKGCEKLGAAILDELSFKSGKLGFLATVVKKIIAHISAFQEAATIDTKDGKVAEFKSYQLYLKEVKNSLNEFTTHKDSNGNQNKLIILVDELDRCLPDMQLKILERLHHLFDVKNCVVVCAVNANSVAQNVRTTYGIDGFEYLRKFFDLMFHLEMSSQLYLRVLFTEFTNVLKSASYYSHWQNNPINVAFECLLHGKAKVLEKVDNREISRYYDAVCNACADFGLENLTPNYVFFIIIGLFVRRYLDNRFLNIVTATSQQTQCEVNPMPYYDYLNEYLGMDRNDLSDIALCDMGYCIPEYSWDFNELIYFTAYDDVVHNQLRRVTGKQQINKAKCAELKRVVLLYGGEPKIKDNK